METLVRLEMTTVGVDALKGDFLLNLGKMETEFGFSSRTQNGRLPLPAENDFLPCEHLC